MLIKIWKNRLEFYPAFVFFVLYFMNDVWGSLGVKHPGIGKLGWFTIPSVILYIIAVVRTYRKLPE